MGAGELNKDSWHRDAATIAKRNAIKLRRWGMRVTVYDAGADSGDYYLWYNLVDTDLQNNSNWQKISNTGLGPAGSLNEIQKNGGGFFAGTKIYSDTDGNMQFGDATLAGDPITLTFVSGERNGAILDGVFFQLGITAGTDYIDLTGPLDRTLITSGQGYVALPDANIPPVGNPTAGFIMWSEAGVPQFRTAGGKNVVLTDQPFLLNVDTNTILTNTTVQFADSTDLTLAIQSFFGTGINWIQNGSNQSAIGIVGVDPGNSDTASFVIDLNDVIGNGPGVLFTDNRASLKGIEYSATGYVTQLHSLTDKEYVDLHQLTSVTVATVPSATPAGKLIYVSNESGGAVPAFSDGTNWRRVTDRAIIS